MNIQSAIELHNKCIRIAEAVQECNRRIQNHQMFTGHIYTGRWNRERVGVLRSVKAKIIRYYYATQAKLPVVENVVLARYESPVIIVETAY